ncbi:unnamed protein product [Calypogeia fissa]
MEAFTMEMASSLQCPRANIVRGLRMGAHLLANSSRVVYSLRAFPNSGRRWGLSLVRAQALPPAGGSTNHVVAAAVRTVEAPAKSVGAPAKSLNGDNGAMELMDPAPENVQTSQLVLMRHGESMWNDLKLFTGDVDIPLTEKGVMEALAGGKAVCEIDFDIIFTSRLVRSKQTALIAMTQNNFKRVPVLVRGGYYGKGKTGDANRLRLRDAAANALEHASCRMVPVYADPALNERCYGDLQGLSKEAAVKEFGAGIVRKWRRSHDTRPPNGESLEDTCKRTVQFFLMTIEPRLKEGRNVMMVAHGNVLRCIISHLSGLTAQEMLALQVVTAMPYAYAFDGHHFAECCVMPPIDPITNKRKEGVPLGITSSLKKAEIDSLI